MGALISKCCTRHEVARELRAKIHVLEEGMKELDRARDREARAYEHRASLFACEEEEWKQERKKHKEETARLRKRLEEEEERVRRLEGEVADSAGEKGWRWVGTEYVVERMKEEQARREVAVEKWKQLYLAIKNELDDLIQRTREGERFCWGAEDGMVEGLRRELKDKEEVIEALKSQVRAMEKEGVHRERQIDILRQSLRILSSTKRNRLRKSTTTKPAVVNRQTDVLICL